MFNSSKILKKVKNSNIMKEAEELDYSKDGSVQINVGLKDVEDFFYPYSFKTYELTNPDVIDYINMCEESIPQNEKISIDIYMETHTNNEEKKRIRKSIKRYYAEKLVRLRQQKKRDTIFGISFIILGIVLLLLESIFYQFFARFHTIFLIEVLGWLFLWDGLESIMGEWGTLRKQQKQCYRILNAKIHVRQYSKKIQREYGIGDFDDES